MTEHDVKNISGTQPRKNMITMGKVDTSDLMMIITWAMDMSFQSPKLKWASWTHTTPWCHDLMTVMASQITSLTIVYSTVYSGTDQRKHQSSALLDVVWGIHRWPVNYPHKGPVTRKMFPFDDVIMLYLYIDTGWNLYAEMVRCKQNGQCRSYIYI